MTSIDRNLWFELTSALELPVRVRLVSAIALSLAAAILTALGPVALKLLVDNLSNPQGHAIAGTAGALYVAALALGRVSASLQSYLFATGSQAFQSRVSTRIFGRLLRLPLSEHIEKGPGAFGQIHTHALQGIQLLTSIVSFTLLPVIVQVTVILTVVGGLFDLSVWGVLAAAIAAYTIVFALGVHRIAGPSRVALEKQVVAGQWFSDALVNAETVKTLTAEGQIQARYTRERADAEKGWRICYARRTETNLLAAAIFVSTIAAMIWLASTGIREGRMSVGDFVLLHAYALQIVVPLESTGSALRDLTEGMTYLDGWRRLLRTPLESDGRDAFGDAGAAADGVIQFKDVSFSYEPGRRVLNGISFAVARHATVAVVGPSGAGKSSLLKLLQGYFAPDAGLILVEGAPLDDTDIDALRGKIGVVSQDVVLFNDTLRFNLMIANPQADAQALNAALSAARLDTLIAKLPAGLETVVGDRGLRLSGGERQRVALARALLRDARILLLDEPTSALDARTEAEISRDLLQAGVLRTTLVITHRLALASLAPCILVLQEGQIVEQGSHAHLIALGGLYAHLWRQQVDGESEQVIS